VDEILDSLQEIQKPEKRRNHFMGFLVFAPGPPQPGQHTTFHLIALNDRCPTQGAGHVSQGIDFAGELDVSRSSQPFRRLLDGVAPVAPRHDARRRHACKSRNRGAWTGGRRP
jgi:hypothetical protein